MKIGTVYPQIETGGEPDAVDKIGLATETLGYDSLLIFDHVVGAVHEGREPKLIGPYTERDPFHDPFVFFSYLAGITKRIEFITGILILPQRQTVLVAKQAADLDLLSRQRLTVGVGSGWNYVEYDALGADFMVRGKMLSEQIPYLRRLWSEPVVSFTGRFHELDRGAVIPRPKRQIPIFCGGWGEFAYKRAAKMADGFIFTTYRGDGPTAGIARVRELLAHEDRLADKFGFHLITQDRPGSGLGTKAVVDEMKRWRDLGGTHASVSSMNRGFRTSEEHIEFFAAVRNGYS